ncbi:MAG: hypothetical protein SFV54_13790 [Bryobacteraceae bacterium]|nr:hypothetical protein [Bryobacteraceae bacterium]
MPSPSLCLFEENVGQGNDPDIRIFVRNARPHRSYSTSDRLVLWNRMVSLETSVRFARPVTSPRPVIGLERWPGTVNRFSGPIERWRRAIPAYLRFRMPEVFPGIDLDVGFAGDGLELIYIVRPSADAAAVTLETGSRTELLPAGEWRIAESTFNPATVSAPQAWQLFFSARTDVAAAFRALDRGRVAVDTSAYDRTQPLFIRVEVNAGAPPELTIASLSPAPDGGLYAGGAVSSNAVCTVSPGATIYYCPDAIVLHINSRGEPVFLTVLSGSVEDEVHTVIFDVRRGDLVVAGSSASGDFAVSANAAQRENAGPLGPRARVSLMPVGDLFVARLDARSGDLRHSALIGTPDGDVPRDVALRSVRRRDWPLALRR